MAGGSKWDDESEKKLLMAILHVLGPQAPTPNWNQVAALMGEGHTGDGIRQKYTKGLKKQALSQFGEIQGDEGSKTPVKRGGKKANGDGGTKSAGSKRKVKKDIEEEGGDDEDLLKTPSKKVKMEESEGDEV